MSNPFWMHRVGTLTLTWNLWTYFFYCYINSRLWLVLRAPLSSLVRDHVGVQLQICNYNYNTGYLRHITRALVVSLSIFFTVFKTHLTYRNHLLLFRSKEVRVITPWIVPLSAQILLLVNPFNWKNTGFWFDLSKTLPNKIFCCKKKQTFSKANYLAPKNLALYTPGRRNAARGWVTQRNFSVNIRALRLLNNLASILTYITSVASNARTAYLTPPPPPYTEICGVIVIHIGTWCLLIRNTGKVMSYFKCEITNWIFPWLSLLYVNLCAKWQWS